VKENFTRSLCEPPTSEQRIHFTSLQRQQQSLRSAFSPSIHLQRSYIAVPSLTDGAVCCVLCVYRYTSFRLLLLRRHKQCANAVLSPFIARNVRNGGTYTIFCSKHVNNKRYTRASYLYRYEYIFYNNWKISNETSM